MTWISKMMTIPRRFSFLLRTLLILFAKTKTSRNRFCFVVAASFNKISCFVSQNPHFVSLFLLAFNQQTG